MQIFIGSTNPVKINSIILATSEQWPEAIVKGFDVPSGISEQPLSDEETKKGSINRAKKALDAGLDELEKQQPISPSQQILGVGLEGGVFTHENGELWSTVWISVVDREGNIFSANGARFKVPDRIANPIKAGQEMGPVVGGLFKDKNIKQKQGAIGIITRGFVDRTEEYSGIAKMALGLWFGREWEEDLI